MINELEEYISKDICKYIIEPYIKYKPRYIKQLDWLSASYVTHNDICDINDDRHCISFPEYLVLINKLNSVEWEEMNKQAQYLLNNVFK